ncbi:hypothetical protein EV363DRAFT_1391970 [Boletus edulis]|nr:hypothetical protein EV363DRAFT_1391970 [Boletus edulis]
MNTGGESAELRQFREKWKKEVRHRRELEEQLAQQHGSSPETHPRSHASPHAVPSGTEAKPPTKSSFSQGTSQKTLHTSHSPLSGSIARAVEIYRSAVQHEQESDLDDALRLYRQAFRLDPDVDRAYFKEEQRLQQPGRATASVGHKKTLSTSKGEGVQRTAQPAEGKESVHTNGILSKKHFATVSRKARVLSLDPLLWRDFVYLAYKPPQIPEAITVEAIVDEYGSDYRQTYIEHPRLRLDGVYIAVCHYVRRGLSENAWVNVNHLITYHRYLRFFPDGQVLSLLANEEYQPPLVIPMLKPSLCMKGFYVGDWRLEGSTVLISNLPTRYHFQMTLTLRSKPLGRWNKLDLVSYESVNIEDGEVMPLPLKHERPFWFSKVRSWQGY